MFYREKKYLCATGSLHSFKVTIRLNYWNIPAYPIYTDVKMYAKLPHLAKELASKREASNTLLAPTNQVLLRYLSHVNLDN